MSFYGGIEDTGRLTEDTMARRKLRPRDVESRGVSDRRSLCGTQCLPPGALYFFKANDC
jgi:hypothetical protein